MDALGVVYPQYWFKNTCESNFPIHMDVLKKVSFSIEGLGAPKHGSQQFLM
jgi:hypothetical protein